ncbi:MAG: AAA family ATPase, partial [Nitrospirae bacterium]
MRLTTQIEFNEEFLKALQLMQEAHRHLLITGRAGTGKSTLLQYFRDTTSKDVVFLAPTGVAAVNIRGQTIHSFFGFRPDTTPETASEANPPDREIFKEIDTIVIDEVSMVRADLL